MSPFIAASRLSQRDIEILVSDAAVCVHLRTDQAGEIVARLHDPWRERLNTQMNQVALSDHASVQSVLPTGADS
jgi:hypothetical protein